MMNMIFWDVKACSKREMCPRFLGKCCVKPQGIYVANRGSRFLGKVDDILSDDTFYQTIHLHNLHTVESSIANEYLNYVKHTRRQISKKTKTKKTFKDRYFFSNGTTAPSSPGRPKYRGFTITFRHTILGRTPLDE
jgi:hypothetical protein